MIFVMSFEQKVKEARKRVDHYDQIDGFKERHLRVILFALEAGLKRRDGCEFDAYVMLKDVVESSGKDGSSK